MKFNIDDKVRFAIPADQAGSFNPSEECADGDWAEVVYVDGVRSYLDQCGVIASIRDDYHFDSYLVAFADGESWWIPASFLELAGRNKVQPTLYLVRGIPGSGKSTLAQSLLDAGLVAAVYEADQYFVDGEGVYKFDPALSERHTAFVKDRQQMI